MSKHEVKQNESGESLATVQEIFIFISKIHHFPVGTTEAHGEEAHTIQEAFTKGVETIETPENEKFLS